MFSIGSFYVGEERVAADLAPFLLAAPNGEVEAFLATQLVDEMRHAVFFDRFGRRGDGARGRRHARADRGGRGAACSLLALPLRRLTARRRQSDQARPTTSSSSSRGSSCITWSPRGCWRCRASGSSSSTLAEHSLYPGFNKGFWLVEQDEHRHIAFGVRFLQDVCEERPEMKGVIVATLRSCCRRPPRCSCRRRRRPR